MKLTYDELKEIAQENHLTDLLGLSEEDLLEELEELGAVKEDDHTGKQFDATQGYYYNDYMGLVTESLENMAKYLEVDPEEFEKEYKRQWEENGDYHIFWTESEV